MAEWFACVPEIIPPVVSPKKEMIERPFHFFNENKRNVKVFNEEILFVESLKEYVKINLTGSRSVVTRFQIGELEAFMNDDNLLRTYRSFLVATDKITAYSATEIEIGKIKIPIGRGYKIQVVECLEKMA